MNLDETLLSTILRGYRSILWIGALSFEKRCIASLTWLKRMSISLEHGILLNYDTDVLPQKEYRVKKNYYENLVAELSKDIFVKGITKVDIQAYSFLNFQILVENACELKEYDMVIVDVTCINKLQAMAFAAAMTNINRSSYLVCYTIPENYGNIESTRKVSGWKDILIAPLKETAMLFNEINSRGIIITGHESDRLIVGLAEIEPTSGLIIISDTPHRPDLRKVSEKNNKKILNLLTSIRKDNWARKYTTFKDLNSLESRIKVEIQEAQKLEAPIILFPFGPKPIVFYTSLIICANYPESAWFVYPIPSSYDINYSEGIEQVVWLNFSFLEITNSFTTSD